MSKERKSAPPPAKGFWIVMACCAIGAITMVTLLLSGEIEGARVAPNIEHKAE